MKESWNILDFTLAFSAQAHDPIFEEMIFKDYVPGNGRRVIAAVDGLLSEYTDLGAMAELHKEGDKMLTEKAKEIVAKLEEKMRTSDDVSIPAPLTAEGIEEVYNYIGEILHLYGQIDIWHTTGLYTDEGAVKPGREEAVRVVEESKNRLRAGLIEKTFFLEEGYFQRFIQAVAEQTHISKKDALQYLKNELVELVISGKKLAFEELSARKQAYVFFGDGVECHFLSGKKAETFYENFCKNQKTEARGALKGMVAYRGGVIRGVAHVVITNQDISVPEAREVLRGARDKILVVPMADARLDADYAQVKAVVADVGGLLSHAAIVAREFKIPCIVGTQNATKKIKTGEKVEVNTDTGIIRILDKI